MKTAAKCRNILTTDSGGDKSIAMKINTKKIQREMKRLGLTLETLGDRFKPPLDRRAVWYIVHRASSLARIEAIAKALELDPKDLII